ncbi:MAG: hypothetical protein LC114_05745, partial [Bryobacterales bacterium]|nr:hypothetical protein [Bryobacterales bacterium]
MEMHVGELSHALGLMNLALMVALALKLVWGGLHLRYRAFFLWVCFQAGTNAILDLIRKSQGFSIQMPFRAEPFDSVELYFYFWFWTEPILVIALVVAVFEVYSLSLERYRGIRTISRRILTLCLVVASLISVFSILPDLQFHADPENSWFLLTNVIRRAIYTSLFAFLILLVSFITVFP